LLYRWSFGTAGFHYQNPAPELEKQLLRQQADSLQAELNLIKQRLDKIEPDQPTGSAL
jgi:hypothetical protein